MSRRRAARRAMSGEVHNDERWTVSYMDMITVLFGMFVLLYSYSSPDEGKFQAVAQSLAEHFDMEIEEVMQQIPPVVDDPEEPTELTDLQRAQAEVDALIQIRDQINSGLAAIGMEEAVDYELDERGLTVRLVSSDMFFASESANLTRDSRRTLDVIGPILAAEPYQVVVEGHADYLRPSTYPTNWELSSARATRVVRYMINEGGLPARRAGAVGFADTRPLRDSDAPEALAANRRVDVVVLSQEPEVVRSLIPAVVADGA